MNLDSLHEDQKERIVSCGIELVAAITDSFGLEEGMKIWDDLSTQFGDSIKHPIFMAMLAGRTSGVVTMKIVNRQVDRIAFFKTVCVYTGLGLREAKDICDEVNGGLSKTIKLIQGKRRSDCMEDLRSIGVTAF